MVSPAVVAGVAFLDLLAVAMLLPMFPSYAKQAGVSPSLYALVSSLYGLGQIVGNPLMGKLGDKYGHKAVLLVSFPVAIVSYLSMALATTPLALCVSRVAVGIVKQTVTVSRALVTDATTAGEDRTRALGRLTAATQMGFVVGPALGGIAGSKGGTLAPAVLAAGLFAVDFLFVLFALPRSPPTKAAVVAVAPHATREDADASSCPALNQQSSSSPSLLSSLAAFKHPTTGPLLAAIALTNLCTIMRHSTTSMQLNCRYGVGPASLGMFMSAASLAGALSNTALVPAVLRLGRPQGIIAAVAAAALAVGYTGQFFAPTFIAYVVASAAGTAARSTLTTCALSMYSAQAVGSSGVAMGMVGSLDGLARVVAPAIGGLLVSEGMPECGTDNVALLAALLSLGVGAVLHKHARPPKPKSQ